MKDNETSVPEKETQLDNLTDDDMKNFGNDIEEEDVQYDNKPIEPDEDEPDEEEVEPEGEEDKTANWELDDFRKAYKNLEKVVGRQGQELGELRKATTTPPETASEPRQKTEADIPNMTEAEVDHFIANYQLELENNPDLSIEDGAKFNLIQKHLRLLDRRKNKLEVLRELKQEQAQTAIQKTVGNYQKENNLSDAEAADIERLAKRLSDDGKVAHNDLEAAYLKLYPEKFYQTLAERQRVRLEKAKAKGVPRLPSGNSNAPTPKMTATDLAKMDEFDRQRYLDSCSLEEVDRLLEEVNKK